MYNKTLKSWLASSYLSKSNQSYIEQIYVDFLNNPYSIDSGWRKIFKNLAIDREHKHQSVFIQEDTLKNQVQEDVISEKLLSSINDQHHNILCMQVLQLINAFRTYGHQCALLDPLDISSNEEYKNNRLELKDYNFSQLDLQRKFDMKKNFGIQQDCMTLLEIYSFLKNRYCGFIGIEYKHILDADVVDWIQDKFESIKNESYLSVVEQKQFLNEIVAAESIERYLGVKFPGAKRFSLEGGDVLIPMLKEMVRYSVKYHNIQEIFFGMAHRGRLNVLVNILGKNPRDLFNAFTNKNQEQQHGSGDVKYHQGLHTDITIDDRIIHLSLLPNPSHLEIISPVIMGAVRARIDQLHIDYNEQKNIKILPISIHGDAAVSAQGIVQETFNMSNARGYNVYGTVHIVVNNQVGFTTSDPRDMRSTKYCTDIAKMVQIPIFHVNADDLESVIVVTRMALNFRNVHKRDVVIDLVCYRRHGHNEADEPSVTQPVMYQKIRHHPTLFTIYSNFLDKKGIVNIVDSTDMVNIYRKKLEQADCVLQSWQPVNIYSKPCINNDIDGSPEQEILNYQRISIQHLQKIAYRISNIPITISMHDRVKKIYHDRIAMAAGNQLFDWGAAEVLAYATLLDQDISIRLSGEDVTRGTFFHRHVVIHDQNNGKKYVPLMHIRENQGSFLAWDSVLSEASAVAFEYGYSSIADNILVIWEAQFGDFANGAQVVIDQFITSGEQKWNKLCGLVMLLPHGFEGQGPEHSSARIERYLQLCAEHNIRVCVPSTPAQIYHVLRQQIICNIHKPLVIISPKSLLRNPMVTSSLEDLANGSFQTVFNESDNTLILNQTVRVIICSGKIYYELLNQRNKNKQNNIVIIRIEQLYPFPDRKIQEILTKYMTYTQDFVWCQEEPKNQGAWHYVENCFRHTILNVVLRYIGRAESAAPAVGYLVVHQQQQKKIIDEALCLE